MRLKFTTTRDRIWETKINENEFFQWMEMYGSASVATGKQVISFLEYKYMGILMDTQRESVRSFEGNVSKSFMNRYKFIEDTLKYNL